MDLGDLNQLDNDSKQEIPRKISTEYLIKLSEEASALIKIRLQQMMLLVARMAIIDAESIEKAFSK